MKKYLFTLFVLSISFYKSNAQSMRLIDTTTTLTSYPGYTFTVNNGDAANLMFQVQNLTSSPLDIIAKKHVIANAGGNLTTFCIGSLCYGSTTTASGTVTIAANATIPPSHATTTFGLSTDFDAFVGSGYAQVLYTVCKASNPTDSVSVLMTYNLGTVGIKQIISNYEVSNIAPNPASNNISLYYDLKNNTQPATIKIYNMLGTLVKTTPLETYSNNTKIDITTLEEGMYFYSVTVGSKVVKTNRLVVAR